MNGWLISAPSLRRFAQSHLPILFRRRRFSLSSLRAHLSQSRHTLTYRSTQTGDVSAEMNPWCGWRMASARCAIFF
ncbi:MAG: hypothetical protein LBC42_03940 [Puniceicoccales bacterium]|nr:hypothetical protein [Puniceicoccales bacterium]